MVKIELNWKWWSFQNKVRQAIREREHDLVVARAGYRSGKTILLARECIEWGLSINKSRILLMAPDYQKGGPSTYRVLFEQLPGDDTQPSEAGNPENSPIVEEYNAKDNRITLVNGSNIWLGSADKWNRYAGSEFYFIGCDEPAHYDNTDLYKLHEMLVSRQTTQEGPNVTLWTSTGAGYNQYYDITERQVNEDEEPLQWADQMKVIVGSSLNNPFLPERDKLERQFAGTQKEDQALHGGFSEAQGLVYSKFNRGVHVVSQNEIELKDDFVIYAYDYGWDDPRVLLEIRKTLQEQYVCYDLYYKREKPVEHLTGKFDNGRIVREGWVQENEKEPGIVYCDHDPEHIEKFKEAGFQAEKATKDIDEGIDEVQSVLEIDEEIGPGLLVVEENCGDMIKEVTNYKEEDVGKSTAEDHALDCLRYGIMGDRYVKTKEAKLAW